MAINDVWVMSIFFRLLSKLRMCRYRRHKHNFKDGTDWFSSKHADRTWLLNCYLRFWNVRFFFKIGRNGHQTYLLYRIFQPFLASITQEFMSKNTCLSICVQNFCCYLKNGWVLPFWMPKKASFDAINEYFGIFPILKLCPIWAV